MEKISVCGFQVPIKYLSLICLVAQNSALVLLMKYSRSVPGVPYLATVAVVVGEVVKLIVCVFLNFLGGDDWNGLYQKTLGQPIELLKLGLVSFLYVIQNNLLYVAVSNLDAATFQVSYQLKILTTAVMSVLLLSKVLSKGQWASLVILFVGVALVQVSPDAPDKVVVGNPVLGLVVVIISCVSSAFAGVYFEKILKGSSSSIWIRNIQLGLWGTAFGLIAVGLKNGSEIKTGGFFQGFSVIVLMVIGIQAAGGLLVAVVVKYADNILKGFATSISIISSSVLSMICFGFQPSMIWLFGAFMVLCATYLYSLDPAQPIPPPSPVLPLRRTASAERS